MQCIFLAYIREVLATIYMLSCRQRGDVHGDSPMAYDVICSVLYALLPCGTQNYGKRRGHNRLLSNVLGIKAAQNGSRRSTCQEDPYCAVAARLLTVSPVG